MMDTEKKEPVGMEGDKELRVEFLLFHRPLHATFVCKEYTD
jgi:hypothetical protein